MNLLRAAATVSSLTLVSRVLGLVREMVLARLFGAGAEMDAFNVAFRLPNLLRRMFAEGAFSQAFVPILSDTRSRHGEERTRELLSHVASTLFWVLLAVSILGVVAAPLLVLLVASGFADDPAQLALTTQLTRWMFPYILFMSLVACAAGVLNTYNRFAVPAITPALLNISFIVCGLWLAPRMEPPILAMAVAVLAGGVAQLAVQLPALARLGMLPRLTWIGEALRDPAVRRILTLMVPALFAVSVAQISLIINTNIASHLATGSVSWLAFADRLMEFPTALLGVAIGTVLLPSLSRAQAQARPDEYSRYLDWGLRLMLLIALPAAVGLGLLSQGVIAVLFQGLRFGPSDVVQTAAALTGYALGLAGLIAVKILAPGFYAQQDVKTPVKIAVGVLVATQLANLVLVPIFAHAGLALSISLGALANAGLLYWGLRRRGAYRPEAGWWAFLLKLAIALALMGGALAWANLQIDWIALHTQWALRALLLAAVISGAMVLYFGALWLMGLRPRDFRLTTK